MPKSTLPRNAPAVACFSGVRAEVVSPEVAAADDALSRPRAALDDYSQPFHVR